MCKFSFKQGDYTITAFNSKGEPVPKSKLPKGGKITRMKSYYERDAELDYAKDKFASENFLDSLIFWTVLVILIIAYILWKNLYQ